MQTCRALFRLFWPRPCPSCTTAAGHAGPRGCSGSSHERSEILDTDGLPSTQWAHEASIQSDEDAAQPIGEPIEEFPIADDRQAYDGCGSSKLQGQLFRTGLDRLSAFVGKPFGIKEFDVLPRHQAIERTFSTSSRFRFPCLAGSRSRGSQEGWSFIATRSSWFRATIQALGLSETTGTGLLRNHDSSSLGSDMWN